MARVLFKKKNEFIKAPCYMCDSARISGDLCDDFDFSAIDVGNTHSWSKRFMICSGNNQPVHLEFEIFDDEFLRWISLGTYYPQYCPNCGRKLTEYFVEDRGVAAYERIDL